MAIITISRELAALGDETARELAKTLGYRLVDKDAIEARMQASGVEAKRFRKYDERKPSFFAALSNDREDYLHYLRAAVLAEAEQGNCVLVGRGASAILAGLPAAISVFLSAPQEIRVARVKSYFQCDEKRAAQIIARSDRDRAGFHRAFFDADWKCQGNYSVSLNTGFLGPTDCAEIIAALKDRLVAGEAEARSAAIVKDMVLGHRIRHRILYENELPIRFLEVSVVDGAVALHGATNSAALLQAAFDAAREVAPGAEIRNEIQTIREYGATPG
ncbi:MAG: cytidylate kinase family protein [Treponema sp.]|nr:cytidylate kinase family protein [Treponema sp.]